MAAQRTEQVPNRPERCLPRIRAGVLGVLAPSELILAAASACGIFPPFWMRHRARQRSPICAVAPDRAWLGSLG